MRTRTHRGCTSASAADSPCFVLIQSTTRALGGRVSMPRERGGSGDGNGCQPWHGPDGSEVQPVRCTPGPCLRRWSPANGIALLRQLGSLGIGRGRARLKAPRQGRSASQVLPLSGEKGKLRSRAGASHEIRDRIALAVPHTEQHYFRSRRIFENVINTRTPFDFKEAGPADGREGAPE